MLNAIRVRAAEFGTLAARALPDAAVRLATKVRADANKSRRAAQKRRKAERIERKIRFGKHAPKVRMPKPRKTSGISIVANVRDATIVITASSQVQHQARAKGENDERFDIFAEGIKAHARPGGA